MIKPNFIPLTFEGTWEIDNKTYNTPVKRDDTTKILFDRIAMSHKNMSEEQSKTLKSILNLSGLPQKIVQALFQVIGQGQNCKIIKENNKFSIKNTDSGNIFAKFTPET